jgi:hypothetical protein
MTQFDRALDALQDPKNEPLEWLLGKALRAQAGVGTAASGHLLLDALGQAARSRIVVSWNAIIHQFRELLADPQTAPPKAELDLKGTAGKAEERLFSFMAEMQAVIHLHSLGYEDFKMRIPKNGKMPDLEARLNGDDVRIEVKNLQEPDDIVRTVARDRWRAVSAADPKRYSFRAVLRHGHRGPITEPARSRLRNIIDQLPDLTDNPFEATLDGDVKISIEKFGDPARPLNPGEQWLLDEMNPDRKPGQMVVVQGFGVDDFAPDVTEGQRLFVKVLRASVTALSQLIADDFHRAHLSVIALRWEPPVPIYDPTMISRTEQKLEALFQDFGFRVKPVIFLDPRIPLDLIKQYS